MAFRTDTHVLTCQLIRNPVIKLIVRLTRTVQGWKPLRCDFRVPKVGPLDNETDTYGICDRVKYNLINDYFK